jgi:hypothetical protein
VTSPAGRSVKTKGNNKKTAQQETTKHEMKMIAKLTRTKFCPMALGMALGCTSAAFSAAADTNAPPSTNAPAALPYGKKANLPFWKRFDQAELEQAGTASNPPPDTNAPPPTPRRIGDPPFDAPPYPDGDWQIGGGPNVIGDPGALRDSPFPLMQAIYDGPNGKAWYDSRVQLYGWWTVSGNVSSSGARNEGKFSDNQTANYPEVYDERSDRVEMDQFVLYVERMADENQLDHVDWGFRFGFLYGLDYRFMASRGFLNDENLLVNNHFYGYDVPMMYANIYFPQVAQGMNFTIGRIISMPDIEQQLAPNNLMASHSIVYSFDNFTMWGLWDSIKLNRCLVLQLGLSCGVDIAPWEHQDPGDQPTGTALIQYIAPNGHDSFYIGGNSINNGQFGFNNLQEYIESYSHKFNDKWWTTFEAQYMYMKHCTTAPTPTVPYQDGWFPVHAGTIAEGGVVNYTMYRFAPNAFLTIRNEWWDDGGGARSGYASAYDENSIGIQYWPNKLIMLRPEVRFEHAFTHNGLETGEENPNGSGAPFHVPGPYDNGTKQTQVTFAVDITYHF